MPQHFPGSPKGDGYTKRPKGRDGLSRPHLLLLLRLAESLLRHLENGLEADAATLSILAEPLDRPLFNGVAYSCKGTVGSDLSVLSEEGFVFRGVRVRRVDDGFLYREDG